MPWSPPRSPYNLLQEQLWDDPWRLFVACIFCNQTRRVQAEPIFWEFLERYPDATACVAASVDALTELLAPLGLGRRRSETLVRMSDDYLKRDWRRDPKLLYGIGDYASAAYRIFCLGEWRDEPRPKDHALVSYWEWLHENSQED